MDPATSSKSYWSIVVVLRATWRTSQFKPPKNKKIRLEKKFLIFSVMELSNSNIKKILKNKSFSYIFSNETPHFLARAPEIKKKFTRRKFFILQETEALKKLQKKAFLIFQKTSYFSGSNFL